jgi:ATP dependent DNA ligase domain
MGPVLWHGSHEASPSALLTSIVCTAAVSSTRRLPAPSISCSSMGRILRRKPLSDRKAALFKLLQRNRGGIQYVWHVDADGAKSFNAACELGLEGIVSKRLTAPYKSGPCKSWIKVKNPKSPAYLRIIDETF